MKVTPLDIRRKEFKRGIRGYAEEDVDIFLDDVADEYERLFQENMELQDRVQRLEEQITGHAELKGALEKTLVTAQVQADEMRSNARKESELILRDAELKGRGIVNDSYAETQRVQQTLVQLKHLEEDFRFKFRSLLDGYIKLLEEGPIAGRGASEAATAAKTTAARPPAGEDDEAPSEGQVAPAAGPAVERSLQAVPEAALDDEDRSLESAADYAVSANEPPPELPGDTVEVEDYYDEPAAPGEPSAVAEYTFRMAEVESEITQEAREGSEAQPTQPAPPQAAQVATEDTQEEPAPQGFFFGKKAILEEAELFRDITPKPRSVSEEADSQKLHEVPPRPVESDADATAEQTQEVAGVEEVRVAQSEDADSEDTREQQAAPRLERTSRQRDDEPTPEKFLWPDEDTKEDSRDFEW